MESGPAVQPVAKKPPITRLIVVFVLPLLITYCVTLIPQRTVMEFSGDKCTYYGWPLHTKVLQDDAIQGIGTCELPGAKILMNYFIYFVVVLLADQLIVKVIKKQKRNP